MIKLYIDIAGIKEAKSSLIVDDNLSYIIAHQAIQEAITNNRDCDIILRENIFKIWFERMSARYPGKFLFNQISLRSLLTESWGVQIPSFVTDMDIEELKLLDIDATPTPDSNFDDFLLGHYFGPSLATGNFDLGKIPNLLNELNTDSIQLIKEHQLINEIYAKRLRHWKQSASKDAKKIIDKFSEDPFTFRLELIKYQVLQSYRKLKEILIPDYYLYDALKINASKIHYDESEINDLINQLEYEIGNWVEPSDEETLISFINSMSGLLMFEFNEVRKILKANPNFITSDVIKQLELRFYTLSNEIKEELVHLKQNIPPAIPEKPSLDWDVNQMLTWCRKEYFPYYIWVCNNSNDFTLIAELGNGFSEWYYNEYQNIIANDTHSLYRFLPNNYELFNSEEAINIVLIIDNLPWILTDELKDAFGKHKITLSSKKPYFAMLPSITEVSKKCLLTGQDRYDKIEQKTYKEILETKGWVPYFEDKHLKYYPNLGAFKNEKNLTPGAYFINYLEIDELFHKSEEMLGESHLHYVKSYLNTLVKVVIDVLEKHNALNKANIHIISDHGATKVKHDKSLEIDPDFFKLEEIDERSLRYLKIDDLKLKTLPSYISDQCYQIDKTKFGTPANYLIPIKNNTFRKASDTVWTHGGILPEEVIIPHMVFRKTEVEIEQPDLLLMNNKFRYAIQKIEFEIGNPNDYLLEDIYISIQNSNFETEQPTIKLIEIEGKSKVSLSFEGKFKQSSIKREQEVLSFVIRFTYNSQDYKFEVDSPISIKSMIETKGDNVFDQLDF